MKKQLQKITLFSALFLSVGITAFGQAIISFNPPNPSVCSGGTLYLSAQLNLGTTPTLSFPYTKISGTEIFVSTNGSDASGNGTVSNPFLTIQAGINAATNGQIVTILPGTYSGVGNVNLSTLGKQITVQSETGPLNTIIDCNLNGRGFMISQGETMSTIIKGLSIINGKNNVAPLLFGSAIFVEDNSGIKIVDCFFINHQEGCIQFGDTEVSGPQSGIENCSFIGNFKSCVSASKKSFYTESCFFYNNSTVGELFGNGHVANPSQYYQNCIFKCNQGNIIGALGHGKLINNSLFIENSTTQGIIYMGTNWSGTNTIDHCTFYNNSSTYYNSGWYDHTGQVLSSIFYPGDARAYVSGNQGSIPFSNSLGNNISGNGNLQGNPLFVDPSSYDFNLAAGSPCLGTGASGSNMGADMSLIPSWMFNFLEHYSGSFDNILWGNGQTSDTITLSINQSQYVSVQFSNCGTTYTDSVWVEVNNLPSINAGNDTTACVGSDFTLSATGGLDYVWSNNLQNGVPFQVNSASWFNVTGTDTSGCSSSDSIYVSVIDPTITAGQSAFCLGDSTALSINTNANSCGNLTGSLQNGLQGWWPFCGNANDESGNGNNGTVNEATLTTDRFGNANGAYSFDGVNDWININNSNSLNPNSQITISAWVNTLAYNVSNASMVVNKGWDQGPGHYDLLVFSSNNKSRFVIGSNIYVESNSIINLNQWTLITASIDSLTMKIYVNGTLENTVLQNNNNSFGTNTDPLYIGKHDYNSAPYYFNGKIDDIGIWNRALTQQEIQQLYNQGNLSSWWSDGTTNQTSIQVQPTQTTTYSVTVSDGVGTCTDSITIQVNNPQINAGSDLSVCEGDSVTLSATGADTYAWDNGVVNGQPFSPTVDGYYTVVGTDTLGCSNTVSVFLDVLQPTTSIISPISCNSYMAPDNSLYTNSGQYIAIIPNAAGCDSTITINLTVNNSTTGTDTKTACDSYTWIDGNTYTESTNSAIFTLQNASGCDSVVTLNLTVNKLQTLNGGEDQSVCKGENVILSASGAETYSWNSGVSDGIAFSPSLGSTTYTVTGTDGNGCTDSDEVIVTSEYCFEIPGALSPNSDNNNDTWEITGLQNYPNAQISVFDRWGQKVYEGKSTSAPWDGKYKEKELPTADYYYVIELGNGDNYNGVVTLKR